MKTQPSARRQLRELLPLIQAGDADAIHEARKLTRRVEAQLNLSSAPSKVRRQWRKFRRAIAPLRDHDAAAGHIHAALRELQAPPAEIAQFKADWQAKRAEALQDLHLPKLPKKAKGLKNPTKKVHRALTKLASQLLQAAPQVLDSAETGQWHEWRKTLKRFRYTLEVRQNSPKVLRDVLDALGRLQDAYMLLGKLAQNHLAVPAREPLIQHERAALLEAQARTCQLWPRLERELLRWSGGNSQS